MLPLPWARCHRRSLVWCRQMPSSWVSCMLGGASVVGSLPAQTPHVHVFRNLYINGGCSLKEASKNWAGSSCSRFCARHRGRAAPPDDGMAAPQTRSFTAAHVVRLRRAQGCETSRSDCSGCLACLHSDHGRFRTAIHVFRLNAQDGSSVACSFVLGKGSGFEPGSVQASITPGLGHTFGGRLCQR